MRCWLIPSLQFCRCWWWLCAHVNSSLIQPHCWSLLKSQTSGCAWLLSTGSQPENHLMELCLSAMFIRCGETEFMLFFEERKRARKWKWHQKEKIEGIWKGELKRRARRSSYIRKGKELERLIDPGFIFPLPSLALSAWLSLRDSPACLQPFLDLDLCMHKPWRQSVAPVPHYVRSRGDHVHEYTKSLP